MYEWNTKTQKQILKFGKASSYIPIHHCKSSSENYAQTILLMYILNAKVKKSEESSWQLIQDCRQETSAEPANSIPGLGKPAAQTHRRLSGGLLNEERKGWVSFLGRWKTVQSACL